MERHFTATGYVVRDGATLLHWHAKVKAWLPPGGHVEPNEDPVQAVLREAWEETGLRVEVVGAPPAPELGYPEQVAPPFTIMVEDIDDPAGAHQHIDLIYFLRPLDGAGAPLRDGWRWVTRAELAEGAPLPIDGGGSVSPPEDVRLLAEHAFRAVGGG